MGDIEKKLFSTVPFIVILILAAIFVWTIFLKNAPTHAAISESIILHDPVTSCLISTVQNNLTWDSTVGGTPTYYILQKLDGDITYSQIDSTQSTSYIDNTNIDSDKKYRYQIRAERGSDVFFSDNEVVSSEAYCQALFSPPQTPCQADGPHVRLDWSPASGNLNAYEIFRDGASIGQTSATNFSDGPNIEGTKIYNYSVKTNWQDGTSKTDVVPATIPTCPPTLTATSGCATDTPGGPKIDLSWNNLLGIQNYQIYRKAQAETNFSLLQTLTDAFYTDYLVQSLEYTYFQGGQASNYVKAIWLTDQKDSEQVTVNIPQCPPFLTVQSNCDEFSMRLSWTATKDATHYNIYRDGVYRDHAIGINSTSYIDYQDSSSCPGQICSHTYYVEAITPGSTLRSNEATKNIDCATIQPPSTPVLDVPSVFCSSGYSYIHLSWTPSDNVSYYVLYRDDGITLTPLQGIETYRDDQVQSSRDYTYYVEAVGRGGPSLPSNTQTITSISCTAPSASTLSTPTKSCITGQPYINLSWTATTNTEKYEIWRGPSSTNFTTVIPVDKSTLNYQDPVSKSTTYYYKIRSIGPPGVPYTDSNVSPAVTSNSCDPSTPSIITPIGQTCPSGIPAVNLSWNPADSNVYYYEIFRNGSSAKTIYRGQTGFDTRYWQDTGLLPSTLYSYKVDAVGYGASPVKRSSSVQYVTTNNCSAPGAFTLNEPVAPYCQGSYPQAGLSWTPSSNTTSYDLMRSVSNPFTFSGLTSTSFTDWGFGNALSFNVSSYTGAYVNLGNPTIPLTGNLTIEFWANPSAISWGRQNPICKAYYAEFCLTVETNGSFSYYHGNGSSYMSFGVPNMFTTNNNWVHVVITRDNATRTMKAYKNGVFVNSTTWSSTYDPKTSTALLYIGTGYTSAFRGILDEVRIYNRVLGDAEIQQHYQATYSNESNLIGLWHFDEGSGSLASDSTNNGNNGTLIAGPLWVQNGLQWQTNYSWQGRAKGPGGSTLSNTTAPVQTLLCPPTKPGLTFESFCNLGVANTTLRWSYTTNTNQYEIYRDGVWIKTITPADPEFSLRTWTDTTGLSESTNYTYYIKAIGDAGTSQSEPASVTSPSCLVPPAPQNFSAVFDCNGSAPRAKITWSDSLNTTYYQIYRDLVPINPPVTDNDSPTYTFYDTGITVNRVYTYTIKAFSPGGSSPGPDPSSSTARGYCIPSIPSINSLSTACESSAPADTISWGDATSFNTSRYEIYRNTSDTIPDTPIYTISTSSPTQFAARTWKDLSGLSILTTYYYWVKAVGPAGQNTSAYKTISTYSCGLTPSTSFLHDPTLSCLTDPPYASLDWTPSTNAYSYNIYRTGPDGQPIYSTALSPLIDKGSYSLCLDGNDDYLRAPNSSSLNPSTITMEAWVYPTSFYYYDYIIYKPSQFILRFYSNTGRVQGYVYNSGGSSQHCTTNIAAPLNQWSHIAQTFDGVTGKVYINGNLGCSYSFSYPLAVTSNSLMLGSYYTSASSNYRLHGNMDEARIYGRVLSQSEISSHANGTYTNESDLRAVWHFDDGSGTIAKDSSGNSNNATLYNGQAWQTDASDKIKVSAIDLTQDYKYKVKAFGADTESGFSNEVTANFSTTCRPAKPDLQVNPECDANNNAYMQLSWGIDPSGNTQYWSIYRDGIMIVPSTILTSYPDTDITPGDTYTYRVSAVNKGVLPTDSDEIPATASLCTKDPSKPSVTAAAACYGYSSRARLNWQEDPLGYTISFNVWRKNITLGEADFTKIESNLPPTQIQYVDKLVPIQNDLRYKLEAVGEAEPNFSDESNQITTSDCNNLPPNPPILSNDPPISTGDYIGVVLHWSDAGNEEAYRLFRKEIGGTWNEIIQLPANEDPTGLIYYADSAVSGLEDNKTYQYVAVSYNKNKPYDSGNPIYSGSFSNFKEIFIPTAKPGNFTLSGAWQSKKINLTWTAAATTNAGGTVTYKVVRSNSPTFSTTYIPACQDILDLQCTDNTPSFSETFYKVIAQNNGGTTDSNIINMALPVMNWKELIPWF